MEAVIAAVYLDAGFDTARDVVLPPLERPHRRGRGRRPRRQDRRCRNGRRRRGQTPPDYVEPAREGPDHAPVFTIEARLSDGRSATAQAGSKRQAEQLAAKTLLEQVRAGQ